MKAWITCALDKNCISPDGSRLNPCCGCHRFDQSALTLIASYFYATPRNDSFLIPPYGFTEEESYFYKVKRGEGLEYFTKKSQ